MQHNKVRFSGKVLSILVFYILVEFFGGQPQSQTCLGPQAVTTRSSHQLKSFCLTLYLLFLKLRNQFCWKLKVNQQQTLTGRIRTIEIRTMGNTPFNQCQKDKVEEKTCLLLSYASGRPKLSTKIKKQKLEWRVRQFTNQTSQINCFQKNNIYQ